MTDRRHCDGPDCTHTRDVDDHYRPNHWLTVTPDNQTRALDEAGGPMHFHDIACLLAWSRHRHARRARERGSLR